MWLCDFINVHQFQQTSAAVSCLEVLYLDVSSACKYNKTWSTWGQLYLSTRHSKSPESSADSGESNSRRRSRKILITLDSSQCWWQDRIICGGRKMKAVSSKLPQHEYCSFKYAEISHANKSALERIALCYPHECFMCLSCSFIARFSN